MYGDLTIIHIPTLIQIRWFQEVWLVESKLAQIVQ